MGRLALILGVALPALASMASARTWYIKSDGTGDAPTIQAGIDLAVLGDTVRVAEGTYYENLEMRSGVVLESENGPDDTVIDGTQSGYVIRCFDDQDWEIVGFTLTNGLETNGGCILCTQGSSGVIRGNSIVGNTALSTGAGIYCYISSPVIIYNVISGNARGGIYCSLSDPITSNNTVYANERESITVYRSSPTIDHNIAGGTEYGIICQTGSDPTLWCNNVWNNTVADYTCTPGAMDFSLDPLFCDALGGDFHVGLDSPCVGHPACGLVGAHGIGCGPTGTRGRTWGAIKAIYR